MSDLLKRLNEVNDVEIHSVFESEVAPYGRVLRDYDFSDLISYMKENTSIPENGNVYVPSVPDMEKYPIFDTVKNTVFGESEIQIGYCNGRNTTYNGFEYHKAPEINVAVTDFMLVLGHSYEIQNNTYKIEQAKVFFVPKGTAIEMFGTTLHLSPCRTCDGGFRDIVILPKGTNTPLETKICSDDESKLLLQKNKWVIAHPEREPLIKQGAVAGVIGENKELKY